MHLALLHPTSTRSILPHLPRSCSGLSSSQHYSGVVLGGRGNLLAPADPLCNVSAVQVVAARAYFADVSSDGQ